MGTITVGRIIDRCQTTLLDETGVQWSESELIDYLNSGMNAIVGVKPDAYIVDEEVQLTTASSKQTLPEGAIILIDITHNLGADGETPGRVVKQIDRTHLDHTNPDWHTTSGPEVQHFTYDKRNPRTFYIYPQPAGTWYVNMSYSAHPPEVDAVGDILPIDDRFENPLYSWVMCRAYAKNSKREDIVKYREYLKDFMEFMGVSSKAQISYMPAPPDESITSTGEGIR